jgi:hypothetical protein
MILETLPETFDTFKLNYSMNKLEYTVTELMKELQTAEALTKKKRAQGEVHATASTSGSKKRPRNAEKKNQPKVQTKKKAPKALKLDKSNDKCHHCNEPGHWRRNCPAYLKTKVKGIVLITEACLVADNVSSWIIDSAATNHICCSLTSFRKSKSLEDGDFCFKWGDGSVVSAKAVGSVTLSFEDRFLNLNNVYYVPSIGKNLISVAQLLEQDYYLKFIKNGIRISFSNSFVTDACMKNGLFYINPT